MSQVRTHSAGPNRTTRHPYLGMDPIDSAWLMSKNEFRLGLAGRAVWLAQLASLVGSSVYPAASAG